MAILFLVFPFRRLLTFFFIFAAPFIFHTLPSRPIARCPVLSFVLFFRRFRLTLFLMTSCALFRLNVLFLLLECLPGICCGSSLLRGPPFEPLSCSFWDLSLKVLFLVALATARRVGELHAVSSSVSYLGGNRFLSYLPEFRAKSEFAANPLPRYFRVSSLHDFVGDLPDELLLCRVRVLQIYLNRTSSLSPRPRSLFVSPRSPTRPLSKNALSFFLFSVILQSLPSSSSSSVVWLLLLLSLVMPLSLPFLRLQLGVLPLSSLLSIYVIYRFLRVMVSHWVRLLLRVQLCNWLFWFWLF